MSDIDDNEICDLADEVRRLTVIALGEGDDDLPTSHPLVKAARRTLATLRDAMVSARNAGVTRGGK